MPAPEILTIGHSNHALDAWLGLLRAAGVTAVADVRSQPGSRRLPHFRKPALAAALGEAGIAYLWLGRELGGRPADAALWRDGHPDPARIAASPRFAHGLARVLEAARHHRLALMCAERDPLDCHRFHLVAPHLVRRGARVRHILADGRLETHEAALARLRAAEGPVQPDLFGLGPAAR